MRPLSKTDLRRRRPVPHPPERVPSTPTGAAEEALLFGESQRTILAPPPVTQERKDEDVQSGKAD